MVCCPARNNATARYRPLSEGSRPAHPVHATGNRGRSENIRDIPGGTAFIGTRNPVLPVDGEGAIREVTMKPFEMDADCVTNARFAEFVDDTGYVTEAERLGNSFVFHAQVPEGMPKGVPVPGTPWWRMIVGANWRLIAGPESENAWRPEHPVVHVSWRDACAFATWAGGRLPTEAEWEHAARGGRGDIRFPWGDKEPDDTDHFPCNIWQGRFPDHNTAADGYLATAPILSFGSNAYGLHNLVGNVWEWTADAFRPRTLSKAAKIVHGGKRGYKTLKGGSFLCHISYCYRYRIAARTGNSSDSTTTHQGFRLVYDPPRDVPVDVEL